MTRKTECTGCFLHQENCRETKSEIFEFICDVLDRYRAGTLSMSLQCVCNVPGWKTRICPQWELEIRVEVERDLCQEATRNVGELRGLINDLVSTVGDLWDNLTRVRMMGGLRGLPLGRGEPQTLVNYEGRLVPIMDPAPLSVPSSSGLGRSSGMGQSIEFSSGSEKEEEQAEE